MCDMCDMCEMCDISAVGERVHLVLDGSRWFSMVHGQVQLHVRMCDETAQLQGEAIGRLGDGTDI